MPDTVSLVARKMMNLKNITKSILESANIRVPRGSVFKARQRDEAWRYASYLKGPVVVKPISGSGGKGVTVDITDETAFNDALRHQGKRTFIVEEFIEGCDYRIIVIKAQYIIAD